MPKWFNPPLTVYHGTDSASLGQLPAAGAMLSGFVVNLAICRRRTDFGQGFYTTTNLHQAEQWANLKVNRSPHRSGNVAVVLRFDLDRNWLAGLDSLVFLRPLTDYWTLVSDCRNGFAPHNRAAPAPHIYDVVYGPVSLWSQTLVIHDCDQISFHTQRSITGLSAILESSSSPRSNY